MTRPLSPLPQWEAIRTDSRNSDSSTGGSYDDLQDDEEPPPAQIRRPLPVNSGKKRKDNASSPTRPQKRQKQIEVEQAAPLLDLASISKRSNSRVNPFGISTGVGEAGSSRMRPRFFSRQTSVSSLNPSKAFELGLKAPSTSSTSSSKIPASERDQGKMKMKDSGPAKTPRLSLPVLPSQGAQQADTTLSLGSTQVIPASNVIDISSSESDHAQPLRKQTAVKRPEKKISNLPTLNKVTTQMPTDVIEILSSDEEPAAKKTERDKPPMARRKIKTSVPQSSGHVQKAQSTLASDGSASPSQSEVSGSWDQLINVMNGGLGEPAQTVSRKANRLLSTNADHLARTARKTTIPPPKTPTQSSYKSNLTAKAPLTSLDQDISTTSSPPRRAKTSSKDQDSIQKLTQLKLTNSSWPMTGESIGAPEFSPRERLASPLPIASSSRSLATPGVASNQFDDPQSRSFDIDMRPLSDALGVPIPEPIDPVQIGIKQQPESHLRRESKGKQSVYLTSTTKSSTSRAAPMTLADAIQEAGKRNFKMRRPSKDTFTKHRNGTSKKSPIDLTLDSGEDRPPQKSLSEQTEPPAMQASASGGKLLKTDLLSNVPYESTPEPNGPVLDDSVAHPPLAVAVESASSSAGFGPNSIHTHPQPGATRQTSLTIHQPDPSSPSFIRQFEHQDSTIMKPKTQSSRSTPVPPSSVRISPVLRPQSVPSDSHAKIDRAVASETVSRVTRIRSSPRSASASSSMPPPSQSPPDRWSMSKSASPIISPLVSIPDINSSFVAPVIPPNEGPPSVPKPNLPQSALHEPNAPTIGLSSLLLPLSGKEVEATPQGPLHSLPQFSAAMNPESDSDYEAAMEVDEILAPSRTVSSEVEAPIVRESREFRSPPLVEKATSSRSSMRLQSRSRQSSRSSIGDLGPLDFDDEEFAKSGSSPHTSPSPSPCEGQNANVTGKTYGGFPVLTWKEFRKNRDNFIPEVYYAKHLPHNLQDHINSLPERDRMHPVMRDLFQADIEQNTVEDEPDAPPIDILNNLDGEPTPPWEFHYSNRMWHSEGVPPPDMKALVGCDCFGKCDPRSKTCACLQRQRKYTEEPTGDFVYDKAGRLKLPGYPIFECNDLCNCDDDCRNRVVQHGRKVQVSIAKTEFKGWGVFAGPKKIPKGTFIGIYAGELLTEGEGHIRGLKYNDFGRTYLFDLDFYFLKLGNPMWEVNYVVDAYHAGNFTRFLNHSCAPNCRLYACYINEGNLEKPLLAVFSLRDIDPYEEICFSYRGRYPEDGDDDSVVEEEVESEDKDAIRKPCQCGAPRCTGNMFSYK